jgi:hypothetical protein
MIRLSRSRKHQPSRTNHQRHRPHHLELNIPTKTPTNTKNKLLLHPHRHRRLQNRESYQQPNTQHYPLPRRSKRRRDINRTPDLLRRRSPKLALQLYSHALPELLQTRRNLPMGFLLHFPLHGLHLQFHMELHHGRHVARYAAQIARVQKRTTAGFVAQCCGICGCNSRGDWGAGGGFGGGGVETKVKGESGKAGGAEG